MGIGLAEDSALRSQLCDAEIGVCMLQAPTSWYLGPKRGAGV